MKEVEIISAENPDGTTSYCRMSIDHVIYYKKKPQPPKLVYAQASERNAVKGLEYSDSSKNVRPINKPITVFIIVFLLVAIIMIASI
jgi:hypothetical protein